MNSDKALLFGGDYNPEQWLGEPEIIEQDFSLFKKANINTLTIGVFSWATLEPEEGRFEFGWMDDIFDRAEKQGMNIILATPSGGKPNWMALKYPEIRRVSEEGVRDPQKRRHNHCLTSPIYRQKVREINERLALRYGQREALKLWHISNEFSGYCYCDLCMGAFQEWLKAKYGDLESLNDAYWSRFWSHTYTEWDQIRTIDPTVSGLVVDWRRFMTEQCCSFIRNELEPIRRITPDIPATTNLMGAKIDYDYNELAKEIDIVSWDSYPLWLREVTDNHMTNSALVNAFAHDLMRGLKRKPYLLMECSPSQVNWTTVSPLMRPGVPRMSGMQALAHGSDSVCYFQMRKGRGSFEQFHGAVIDHVGHSDTRVFREVSALGDSLNKLKDIAGADYPAKVAVIFDWECRWFYEIAALPHNDVRFYVETVVANMRPFWELGINIDIVNAKTDLSDYDLVVAPILFSVSQDTGERLTQYVKDGGTLVTTYGSGIVDEKGLAIAGGMPGPLREVTGIWIEESDALPDPFRRRIKPVEGTDSGLSGDYEAKHYLDLIHLEGAEAMAVYDEDFYAGYPALTRNQFGKGSAWHIASRNDKRFTHDLFKHIAKTVGIERNLDTELPEGVSAQARVADGVTYLFLINFSDVSVSVDLAGKSYTDVETEQTVSGKVELGPKGAIVLK